MSQRVRRLPNRPVLIFIVFSALAVNQLRVALINWGMTLWHPGFADFGNYYLYARVGLDYGWNHLYDTVAQQQEWLRLGGSAVIPWFPIIYPPPLAWVVVPLTLLPLPLAFAGWTVLLTASLLVAWRLVSSGRSPIGRWTFLAGMLAIGAVPYALLLGQVLILELAGVALAWSLLAKNRDAPAGAVLIAIVFKPQVALMVPVVLVVIGRWKALATWLVGSSAVAILALITTGVDGIDEYLRRLVDAAGAAPQFFVSTQLTIAGLVGWRPATIGLTILFAIVTLAAARRYRHDGPSLPIACGLIGSMLITPYLHAQDVATLLLAGGIALHGGLDRWRKWMLAGGYLALLGFSYWAFTNVSVLFGGLLVILEAVFLLSAALMPMSGGAREEPSPLVQIPLDRSA
ncbi:MAG TPA: glycosyltransferase family 87 protein [Candidatus Acidoferrum sp.]|nr:glycosyltransferase family 87 protein [Candidatus Acidoferrum sp.]